MKGAGYFIWDRVAQPLAAFLWPVEAELKWNLWGCSAEPNLLASCALHAAHQQKARAPCEPYGMIPISQWGRLWPKLQWDFGVCVLHPPSRMECCVEAPGLSPGSAVVRAIHNQIIFHSPTPGYCSSPRARVLGTSSDVPARHYGHPCAVWTKPQRLKPRSMKVFRLLTLTEMSRS